MKIAIYFFLATFFLTSCVSSQINQATSAKETFIIHTSEEGAKQFSYSLKFDTSKRKDIKMGKGRGRSRAAGAASKGDIELKVADKKAKAEKRMMTRLDDKLVENQYCINGYTVIDKYIGRGVVQIKGECR